MASPKPIILDGRTGEGGGQLVRIACALAAVTSQTIRITNVRGNRAGPRGGGLKSQHVSSIAWLARATGARVSGLAVGSHTLDFAPALPPTALRQSKVTIDVESSAASAMLIFQAVLPYLLFAADAVGDGDGGAGTERQGGMELDIQGGTNVSFSLSWEYLDQVLLPTLEDQFGVKIERRLKQRGWSLGPMKKGCVWFRIRPLALGEKLKLQAPWDRRPSNEDFAIQRIDVSILTPTHLHAPLQKSLVEILDKRFPDIDINFKVTEDSGHDSRMYVLLVAHSKTGLRWGRDYLYDKKWKQKTADMLAGEISRKVSKDLYAEVALRGVVDEFLQDQLVVYQVLAEGFSSFPRDEGNDEGLIKAAQQELAGMDTNEPRRMRKDKTHEPFGQGSTHTTTVRWVASELLPKVNWFNKGSVCEGAGISFP